MTYQEALKYLYDTMPNFQLIGGKAFNGDLKNSLALTDFLGAPQDHFPSIHIAGTNGKGSTAHLLSAVFQAAGYKVGLFTSPHYRDFRERIKINGQYISQEAVIEFTQKIPTFVTEYRPSFFELTTGMAFDYFRHEKVDIAIIETGLGGRLDSTNILNPILSIITNIGFDHEVFLGDTLAKIAFEKAGIIKTNTPVVIGQEHVETKATFVNKALESNAAIYFAQQVIQLESIEHHLNEWVFNVYNTNKKLWEGLHCSLSGDYQLHNIKTVLTALEVLKDSEFSISRAAIYKGFKEVKSLTNIIGRWDILQASNPLIICDSAHNEDGMAYVQEALKKNPHEQLHIVFGMVNDKSPEKLLQLLPKDASYYFCKAEIPRALATDKLLEVALKLGLSGQAYPTVRIAFDTAKASAASNDLIFVGGSIFTVAEII